MNYHRRPDIQEYARVTALLACFDAVSTGRTVQIHPAPFYLRLFLNRAPAGKSFGAFSDRLRAGFNNRPEGGKFDLGWFDPIGAGYALTSGGVEKPYIDVVPDSLYRHDLGREKLGYAPSDRRSRIFLENFADNPVLKDLLYMQGIVEIRTSTGYVSDPAILGPKSRFGS